MALGTHIIKKYPLLRTIRQWFVWILLYYLRFFARIAVNNSQATIIGIAGAVGKSTTRNALEAILANEKPTKVVSGNSETGIPLGLLSLSIGTYSAIDWLRVCCLAPFKIFSLKPYTYIIVEMGIDGPNAPKNMAYLLTIIKPHINILLSESPAHIQNYEQLFSHSSSLQEQTEIALQYMTKDDARMLLTKQSRYSIVAADDTRVLSYVQKHVEITKIGMVGNKTSYDVYLTNHYLSEEGTSFDFKIHTHGKEGTIHLEFPTMVLPEETGISLASAILTGIHLQIPIDDIEKRLIDQFRLPPGRASLFQGIGNSLIIDSSYNASGASVTAFLQAVVLLKKETKRPTLFIFGDMKELGPLTDHEHVRVAEESIGVIDHMLCIGPITKRVILPILEKKKKQFDSIQHFSSPLEAGVYLQKNMPTNAIVLVKGSQLLEETIKYILKNKKDAQLLCRQDTFWEQSKMIRGVWAD